jgi:hypothetical protein
MMTYAVSFFDSTVFVAMFAIAIALLYAYIFEYVRYKTLKPPFQRRRNQWLIAWIALMGLYAALRISPLLALIIWALDALLFLWDKYLVAQK